jgi:septal ring-binding cell division protein DamX
MMNARIITTLTLGLAVLFTFFGCQPAKRSPLSQVHQTENLCERYPFLKAYQCSFDRVQFAARHGDANAQYALGYLYYYGVGVLSNEKLAIQWIQAAASRGNLSAKRALTLLSNGKQVSSAKTNASSQNVFQQSRGKNDGRAKTATCVSRNGYTIQIAASRNFSKLREFASQNERYFKTEPFIYHTKMDNAPWFVLTYGRYSTHAKAQSDLYRLPSSLKVYQPWVKSCALLLST